MPCGLFYMKMNDKQRLRAEAAESRIADLGQEVRPKRRGLKSRKNILTTLLTDYMRESPTSKPSSPSARGSGMRAMR